jgi:hypothetical protein
MKKKSQVQMGETIAVLFVFFILVFMGFMFYTKIIKANIGEESAERNQLKAIEIAQRVSFLPELQCSQENIVTDNCIDILKLGAASEIIPKNEIFYYDKFLLSTISIKEIYPGSSEWILYDRPPEGLANKISTNIPIALFNATQRKYSFGVLTINTFNR